MSVLATALIAGSFSCNQMGGGSATPKTLEDSTAYALGLMQGSNIAANIERNNAQEEANKIDSLEFFKGLEEGLNNPSRFGYFVGGSTGASMAQQLKSDSLGAQLFLAGLRAAILGDSAARKAVMTEEMAQEVAQKFQEARMAREAEKQFGANKTKGAEFIEAFKKEEGVQTTASGLAYKVLKSGEGASPTATDMVKVKYVGTLIDGTEFDKNEDGVEFQLDGVIPGWTEMLQLMKVGDKVKVVIPQELAYGSRQTYTIEPFSTLVFEIELLEVKKAETAHVEAAK